MVLAPNLRMEMAQRVVQLWKWSGYDHQSDFALAISGEETLMSKWKKGESLTTEKVLQIAHFCAGRQNIINDPATVLLFLFGLREEGDVWVPRVRLVGEDQPDSDGSDGSPDLTIGEPLLTDLAAA